jgi:threonine dehydrogenase-like Zn-dependent dehydrogenase
MLDVPEPVCDPDDVLIEVAAVGICGSELHGISKPGFRKPPLVMGHEFAGISPDGTRVAVNPIVTCGECDRCVAGAAQVCRQRQIIGVHRPGAFAERVAVPRQLMHPIPDSLDLGTAALIEPLANGVHAWAVAGRPAGARVAILGAGTIGLVCLMAARRGGASRVTIADPSSQRRDTATRLGADEVGSRLTGEFDVTIDAVGLGATRAASLAALCPAGVAVWLGLMDADAAFDALDLVRQEKRVAGSFAYTDSEFVEAIALAGEVDTTWLTHFPLARGAVVFDELMRGRTDIVKAVLRPEPLNSILE